MRRVWYSLRFKARDPILCDVDLPVLAAKYCITICLDIDVSGRGRHHSSSVTSHSKHMVGPKLTRTSGEVNEFVSWWSSVTLRSYCVAAYSILLKVTSSKLQMDPSTKVFQISLSLRMSKQKARPTACPTLKRREPRLSRQPVLHKECVDVLLH